MLLNVFAFEYAEFLLVMLIHFYDREERGSQWAEQRYRDVFFHLLLLFLPDLLLLSVAESTSIHPWNSEYEQTIV